MREFHALSWSGGKDSTASVILAHLHNEPLDAIIFSEVMFDKKNGVSGELPEHIDFIKNKAKPLFESWGYKVYILHAETDYLDNFTHIIKRAPKNPDHVGKKYGFCVSGLCSIKRDCKIKPIENFYKEIKEPIKQYVGIAIDEPKRLISMHKCPSQISLLEKYNLTEKDARKLCEKYDLLSPSYKYSRRQGCFFCPNCKLAESKQVFKLMPKVWEQFVALEKEPNLAFDKWNPITKETLAMRDEKVRNGGYQMSIFDFLK